MNVEHIPAEDVDVLPCGADWQSRHLESERRKAEIRDRIHENMKNYKIAVAGTGYVGLSLSVLLAQHNQVMAVDIVQAKVDMINNHKSPIQDDYIEKYTGRRKTHDEREKTEPDDPEAA